MKENDEEIKKEEKKNIEIISDDGSTLNISDVRESINSIRPKTNDEKPKNIIIPESKK